MDSIKELKTLIESLTKQRDWCRDQVEGLARQIDDSYRNDEYWDTKDLISQRREEAWGFEREIQNAKQKLQKLLT